MQLRGEIEKDRVGYYVRRLLSHITEFKMVKKRSFSW